MALPPLYKYLDVRGAKLTLGNNCFRHAKPSDFNDVEDLTIQSIFPEETKAALKKLEDGFANVIIAHLNDPPTCSSPMREKLILIQQAFRANPQAIEILKTAKENGESVYDVERMRECADAHVKEINEFMQGYRVLCVTTHRDSDKMWTGYAENHKGIALRIEGSAAKVSKFQLFRPVIYRESRPALYDDALEFIAGALFGNLEERCKAVLEKIIYSKTLKWQHEGEYRLAIPLGKDEPPYDTLKYHPEEITELYLGLAMNQKNKEEIVAKAKGLNPKIAIFQVTRDLKGAITFKPIS